MHGLRKSCGPVAVFFKAIALLSSLVTCTNAPLKKYKEARYLMETFVTITVYSLNGMIAQEAIVVDNISRTGLEMGKPVG